MVETKLCSMCNKEVPTYLFGVYKKTKAGGVQRRQAYCRDCAAEKSRQDRLKKKEAGGA